MLETLVHVGLGVTAIATVVPLEALLGALTGIEDQAAVATRP